MKYAITSFILALLFLCACDEEEISRKTDPLPDGVMRLSATVSNGVKTRVLNEPLGDATADEKRVDRLAFFVYTEKEGMQVYPPAPADQAYPLEPNKVHLTDNADGTYTAIVDLTAGGGYEADVIAVANLPEDYDYSQIVTWQGLLDSVTVATTTMPLCTDEYDTGKKNAFIMYATASVALHKEKEATASFAMERLAARIDITNKAYGTAQNAFVLTGARILQAKPASYITPHDLYASPDVVTVSNWTLDNTLIKLYNGDVKTENETTEAANDAVCQAAWHALYTYENDDVAHAPTCLEVTGTMNGATITRKIPFEVTDADGVSKKPVPIVRNHRYLVQISPAPGLTDIAYKLTVDEWNAVDTVNVQPNQDQMPVISNYACGDATKTYGTFDADAGMPDTIVVPADKDVTITFTASCPFDTRVTVEYASDEDATGGWLQITDRSEANVITKAGNTLERTYTITIKASPDLKNEDPDHPDAYVNRAYLYIANGGNGSMVDTVTVYQGVDVAYGETRFAGVTLGQLDGKDLVWAPINVGATRIATEMKSDDYNSYPYSEELMKKGFEQCGYYYQWGRNVPFKFGTAVKSVELNPLPTYQEACQNIGKYANSLIAFERVWFSDNTSTNLSPLLQDMKWPREYQPCPVGWHVPSKDELEVLAGQSKTQKDGIGIYGEGKLFIPAAGFLMSYLWNTVGTYQLVWSSTYNIPNPYNFNSGSVSTSLESGFSMPIRCVKDN